jgi:predicted dehydrogenase
MIANIHVSCLDPQKARKMVIVGSHKMVVYDDIAENKILIYDKRIERRALLGENMDFDNPRIPQFNYDTGDILIPEVKFAEPLRAEAEHFADCIRNSREPLTGIHHARSVVLIVERARPLNGEVVRHNSSV